MNEDDWDIVPMYAKLGYPLATTILAPDGCRMGQWEHKTVHYNSYHELAYLHPDVFAPDRQVVEQYFPASEPYFLLRFAKLKAHHVLAFASLQIGDSQTMAAEAGVLGTPFVRFNDFVGRISYLEELEKRYGLGFGVRPDEPELLLEKVAELAKNDKCKEGSGKKREKMLGEKIALTPYLVEYLESYGAA